MTIIKKFQLDDKCSYLDNLNTTTEYKLIEKCSIYDCEDLIQKGYRRFGKMFFRPICSTCNECQSIKIDVENFKFSKSKRRVLKKASHIKTIVQTPNLSQEHLDLFAKYHLYMKEKKDWSYNETTADHYYNSFVSGHEEYGYEVLYFDEDKLIGVDLIDILDDGISSIYFYYDPDYSELSLGKYSLYNQINIAKNYNKKWIYLGYYVQNCPSLSYKSEYKPYLTLEGRPIDTDNIIWK